MPLPLTPLDCPACHGDLERADGAAVCQVCQRRYPDRGAFLDLRTEAAPRPTGLGPRLMYWRPLARAYERLWRPAFVAVSSGRRPDFDREYDLVRAWLAPAAGGVLADLSCGPGVLGRRLAASGDFARVYGVDLSAAMLIQASRLNAADGTTDAFPLVRADVARLPLRDASLAGAHAGAAMHLWPDVPAALSEVARVLRPGGVFVASTFTYRAGSRLGRAAAALGQRAVAARLFDEGRLARALVDAGLVGYRARRWGTYTVFRAVRPG